MARKLQHENRFQLETMFKREVFELAEREETTARLAAMLGYKGKWKGRRWAELRSGTIMTMTLSQLKKLSEITDIPLEEILKHASAHHK